MLNGKVSLCKMNIFSEPYSHSKKKMKVELESSNYATKTDLKGVAGNDRLKGAKG